MKCSAVRLALFGVCGVLLAGCVATSSTLKPAPKPAPVAAKPVPDRVAQQQQRLQQRQQKIARLLELAEDALAHDRLMHPAEDNAYDWYRQVLDLDELNTDAHWGMHRITQRYLQLAERAFKEGKPNRAEAMLKGALQIAATPAQAEAIRAKYREQMRDKVFALSAADLRARNQAVQERLGKIARIARERKSRLLIVAHNDAEGRWIYKQMRTAVDGFRLRGNIELGSQAQVVLIDL